MRGKVRRVISCVDDQLIDYVPGMCGFYLHAKKGSDYNQTGGYDTYLRNRRQRKLMTSWDHG